MFTRLLLLCILLGALLHGSIAQAHESRPAYLEINETVPGRYKMLWRTPINAGMQLPVVLKLPDDVRNIVPPSVKEFAGQLLERRLIDAGKNGLGGKRIELIGLQATITDVLVRVQALDGHTRPRWCIRRSRGSRSPSRKASRPLPAPTSCRAPSTSCSDSIICCLCFALCCWSVTQIIVDHYRFHARSQHNIDGRDIGRRPRCRGAGGSEHCAQHPFPGARASAAEARRARVDPSLSVADRLLLWTAARPRLRQRARRNRAATRRYPACAVFLQCRC